MVCIKDLNEFVYVVLFLGVVFIGIDIDYESFFFIVVEIRELVEVVGFEVYEVLNY